MSQAQSTDKRCLNKHLPKPFIPRRIRSTVRYVHTSKIHTSCDMSHPSSTAKVTFNTFSVSNKGACCKGGRHEKLIIGSEGCEESGQASFRYVCVNVHGKTLSYVSSSSMATRECLDWIVGRRNRASRASLPDD
eukprot:5694296-Amphidinium_carterae.1